MIGKETNGKTIRLSKCKSHNTVLEILKYLIFASCLTICFMVLLFFIAALVD